MQHTGLVIKVSIALVSVMGSAFAQNWHAHLHDNLTVTAIPQENKAFVGDTMLAGPQVVGLSDKPIKHTHKKSVASLGKTNLSTLTDKDPAINFSKIVNNDPTELAEISPEETLFPQNQKAADLMDPSRAAAVLPSLAEQPHTSPVPEASTSLSFGGMLMMGVGLMLFSSWKRSQKQ